MSFKTNIQWCDSTVNPVMGCKGCELFSSTAKVLRSTDNELIEIGVPDWSRGHAKVLFTDLLGDAYHEAIERGVTPPLEWKNELSHTNLYHLRFRFAVIIAEKWGKRFEKPIERAVSRCLKCYAAQLHANRGFDITKPQRIPKKGYTPVFEVPKQFPGRMSETAKLSDLTASERPHAPWLNGLPRLIFTSDMGDAFSNRSDFGYLQAEVENSIVTENGRRHLWLWLAKRPQQMAEFATRIGGFPANVCAMTTVTSSAQLGRVGQLQQVDAQVRGLSIEPLWDSVADKIDLRGIDWVIVGGESGAKHKVVEFQLTWATELRERCREEGVAFFLKQLGRRPVYQGEALSTKHQHGGDWDEWPAELRTRQMPQYFRKYDTKSDRLTTVLATT